MPDEPDDETLRAIKAQLLVEEAKEARERATRPEIDTRIMRPKDWADMASYLLPMVAVMGLYIDEGGTAAGTFAVGLITALLVGVLHYLNSLRTKDY